MFIASRFGWSTYLQHLCFGNQHLTKNIYINTFAIHLGSSMLKSNYSKLNLKKSFWGESNIDCKGLAHVTRKICKPPPPPLRKCPTNNPSLKHRTQHQENTHSSLSYKIDCLHDIDYHKKNKNMLWLLMTCTYKSQHIFFVKIIYAKTILPI